MPLPRESRDMKILVTGGAGFIGSHLTEALVKAGHAVRVLDNFSTGRRENLRDGGGAVEVREGDVRDGAAVEGAMAGTEAVFHLAALPSVPRSFADPLQSLSVNAGGTLRLLESARRMGVDRFIYASSSSVYGDCDAPEKSESLPPRPLSPYAVSKLSGEYLCRLYHQVYRLPTFCLRYFNIFGPRQDPSSEYAAVIPRFIAAVLKGKPPVIYGDGRQTRDFTFVANAVSANLKVLSAPEAAAGGVFNVACGEGTSLLQLVECLGRLTGRAVSPEFAPARPGDVKHSRADLSRSRSVLGYSPEITFAEGLKRTSEWFRARPAENI